jgi:putative hemolysin
MRRIAPGPVARALARAADEVSGLAEMRRIYDRLRAKFGMVDAQRFVPATMEVMGLTLGVSETDLARIPKTGPLVVVANHPFGGIEGIVLADLVQRVRPDVKILANEMLQVFEELRPMLISVDVFDPSASARKNASAVLESVRHLKKGGCLILFPAGEVSHFSMSAGRVTDGPWQAGTEVIVRRGRASVLPVFVPGSNGVLFNLAGVVHPRLRTALLPRAFLAMRNRRVELRVGSVTSAKKIEEVPDGGLNDELRRRVYMLRHREVGQAVRPSIADVEPVIAAVPSEELSAEIARLPEDALLSSSGEFASYVATSQQIPSVLREIGRLRELTFRAVGEGTSKSCDLDAFDDYYLHIFVWNRVAREVVGAYRIGQVDRILAERGKAGLYSSSLFEYPEHLLTDMGTALEMGRSFVRAEYQRGHQSLLMLWKGIGAYIGRNPRYHVLFGPVSISGSYATVSRELMVRFLSMSGMRAVGADLVRARAPFRSQDYHPQDESVLEDLLAQASGAGEESMAALGEWVSHVEVDAKGIPVLLSQYLKWGARVLAFNVDNHFGGCLDALVTVDLRKTERRLLSRYMGDENYERFLAYHRDR